LMVVLVLLGGGKSVGEGKSVIWALIPHRVGRAVLTGVSAAALPAEVGVELTGVSEERVALLGVSESTIRVSMVIEEGEVAWSPRTGSSMSGVGVKDWLCLSIMMSVIGVSQIEMRQIDVIERVEDGSATGKFQIERKAS
jgi:hypothetical protein